MPLSKLFVNFPNLTMFRARSFFKFFAFLLILLLEFGEISSNTLPARASCEFDGKEYKDGEKFLKDCSPCTCSDGQYSCSFIACENQNCRYKDISYGSGERFMDGCKSCICANAKVECDSAVC